MKKVLCALVILLGLSVGAQAAVYPTPLTVLTPNLLITNNQSFWINDGRQYQVVYHFTFECVAVGKIYLNLPKAPLPYFVTTGIYMEDFDETNSLQTAKREPLMDGNPSWVRLDDGAKWECHSWDIGVGNSWEIRYFTQYWARG